MSEASQAFHGVLKGRVTGKVQGVFFRAETQRQARLLGLTGWVRNLASGEVEVLICGEAEALERMRQWLCTGPVLAKVDAVELAPVQASKPSSFEIVD